MMKTLLSIIVVLAIGFFSWSSTWELNRANYENERLKYQNEHQQKQIDSLKKLPQCQSH